MSSPKANKPRGELAEFGRSWEDLDFWLACTGAPLLVLEKHELIVRRSNRSASLFFGMQPDNFVECHIKELVGEAAAHLLGQIWNNAPMGTPGEPFLVRAVLQQQERLLMVQVTQLIVEGELLRLFTFVDAPPQGSVALVGWQENIIAMLNWLPFGFEIATADDQIQFANFQFNHMFGYSQHEVASIDDWWRLAYPDPEYREYAKTMWETSIAQSRAEDREMTPFDLDVTIKDGSKRTVQFRNRTIGNFNINLYLDVTRERAYARELKLLAEADPLTGIMNRRRFFEEAERCYNADPSLPMPAVLMLDIDNFKRINDVFGHGVGDIVLKEFTRRCKAVIRSEDLFARMGGEEFVILLSGASAVKAGDIGQRIIECIRALPFECDGVRIDVTVSIGATWRLLEEDSVEPTVSRADRALYSAKHDGRDRMAFDEPRHQSQFAGFGRE
jgi:diguanylate cyclase (GGDEF)-like protein